MATNEQQPQQPQQSQQQQQEPDFVLCTQCESPVYTFDWNHQEGKLASAMCPTCGNEESEEFRIEEASPGED